LANFIIERSVLNANQDIVNKAKASLSNKSKLSDVEKFKAYNELDYKAKAALRTEVVDLKVNYNMIGLDFFERIELQPDEVPAYEVESTRARIPVDIVSQFGAPAQTIWSSNNARTLFELGMIESDRVRTQRFDLYQGFSNRNDKLNKDIADSVAYKLDDMAWVAVAAGIGALANGTNWVLDTKIKNAPTTNDLDLSAECDGKLTKYLFKSITEHFDRIGKPIRAVYLPAARKHDLFDWVSVSDATTAATDTIPSAIQEEIWKNGLPGGALMPPCVFTNMLEGETAGSIYAYAVTNEAPGYFFQKPAFHVTDENDEGAWHYAQTIITGSFVIPAYRKMNIARIKIG
jgi:hypothetical protein